MLCVLRAHAFGSRKRGSGCDNVVASWPMLRVKSESALCSYGSERHWVCRYEVVMTSGLGVGWCPWHRSRDWANWPVTVPRIER